MIIWEDLDVMVHFTESCICYEPTIIDINGMGKTTKIAVGVKQYDSLCFSMTENLMCY